MANRRGSYRRKTRKLMTKNFRGRGKINFTRYLAEYKDGEKILLKTEPAVQDGIYHLRYHGKTGIIKGRQGRCYAVEIMDGSKPKKLIVHPVHFERLK